MPGIDTIIDTYINSERHFRKAINKFAGAIVKDINRTLKMDFKVKEIVVSVDGVIDIEMNVGNKDYSFLICVYYMPAEDNVVLYRLHDTELGKRIELNMSSKPENVAEHILSFIDPRDIVKTRKFRQ